MKKIVLALKVLFTLVLLLAVTALHAETVTISTQKDFTSFANRVNAGERYLDAVLSADIVAERGVNIAQDYSGTFDGRGHKITINLSGGVNQALFYQVTGEGRVKNLAVAGTIQCTDKFAAGVCASLYGSLENCISTVTITSTVSGDGTHGGLVAISREGAILSNCIFGGTISGSNTNCCGGLVGWAEGTTFANNCAQVGSVNVGASGSATLARNNGNLVTNHCYYMTLVNSTVKGGTTRITRTNITNGTLCTQLNQCAGVALFTQPSGTTAIPTFSSMLSTGELPRLTDVSISTPAQLAAFAERVNNGETSLNAVLTADLDMQGVSMRPIGFRGVSYKGVFDGQHHVISNLQMDYSSDEFVGLFGTVSFCTIKNLTLDKGCSIRGLGFVGLIGGVRAEGLAILEGLGNEGAVSAINQNAGGIIGCNFSASACLVLQDCYVAGQVTGGAESAALSGWLGKSARLRHCYGACRLRGVDGNSTLFRCESTHCVVGCYEQASSGRQTGIAKVSDMDIISGRLCIDLNDGATRSVWHQTLGEDRHPVLLPSHDIVTTPNENVSFPQDPNLHSLIINEVQVANIDQFVDPSFNYGGWVELYNPTNNSVDLGMVYVTDDAAAPTKFQLPESFGSIPAKGYLNIWFDHNSIDGEYGPDAYKQVPFKLQAEGGTIYLYDANKTVIAQVTYPASVPRCSFARLTDGNSAWGMTASPTPQASNDGIAFASERLPAPVVQEDSRLFDRGFTLHVSIPQGATLRYTTDGSTPTLTNGRTNTSGSIYVTASSKVYRFCLFRDGYLPSPVVTRSYIYKDKTYNLPVLSITTNADNLYDDIIGVYVDGTNGVPGRGHGKSNVNMDWERPVNMEYILPDGTVAVNQEAWFHVCGGWNRHIYPQRSFKLKANKELEGQNSFDYAFFADKPHNRYKSLLVRNGGNDTGTGRVQDGIIQNVLLSSGLYLDGQAWQPVHVLFNGKYFATMNLRESSNKFFGSANYGIDTDEMDVLELLDRLTLLTGDDKAFFHLLDLSYNASSPAVYEEIRSFLDVDEVANYMAAQCYLGSWDWITHNNNTKLFRSKNDGKFHFVMYDVESAVDMSYRDMWNNLRNNQNEIEILFNNLCKNPDFMRLYLDAYCLIDGSVFTQERTQAVIDEALEQMIPAMGNEGIDPTASAYRVLSMLDYRADKLSAMRSYFGLPEGVQCTLSANIDQARLLVNTSPVPTGKFSGTLFPPIELTAWAPEGYRFVGWSGARQSELVFGKGSTWHFYDGGELTGSSWRMPEYNESRWQPGATPIGYSRKVSVTTPATEYRMAYYFRKEFTLPVAPQQDEVYRLEYSVDDACVVYVNGVEAGRSARMPQGDIAYDAELDGYADNPEAGVLDIPSSLLRRGSNVIAVEVHNNVITSSDIYWDASLNVLREGTGIVCSDPVLNIDGPVDGPIQAVFEQERDACVPPVRINEVSASNAIYVNEYFEKEDWVELYNTTSSPIDISGMYLSDNPSRPTKFEILPVDGVSTTIPAGGTLLVWADKRESMSQLHAPFRLSNADGSQLSLLSADGAWKDVLVYNQHSVDQTYGRFPDGGSHVCRMSVPTIGRYNMLSTYDFDGVDLGEEAPQRTSISFALAKGWNWFSHNISEQVESVRVLADATALKGQSSELILDPALGWMGNLPTLQPATGYKIQASRDHELTLMGLAYDPDHAVSVDRGWNWVGCPLARETVLPAALQNYDASEGDRIVGQEGFAIYTDGAWTGSLATLAPGRAYMLHSAVGQDFCWNALSTPSRAPRRYATAIVPEHSGLWQASPHAHPDVMNIIATVALDGEVVDTRHCVVGAFCGDECRGVAEVEDGKAFLTVYGDATELLTFRVMDESGETYEVPQRLPFQALSLVGTVADPCVFMLSTPDGVSDFAFNSKLVETQFYSLGGQRLPRPMPGICIRKCFYENGRVVVSKVLR